MSASAHHDCDVLILGGGCAGLSLAAALTERCSSLRVTILESRNEYARDRTWCLWNTEPHPFGDSVTHRWNTWSVSHGARRVVKSSQHYDYEHIPADRFYESALARIQNSATQQLCLGVRATKVDATPGGYRVESSSGALSAPVLFDSRPTRSDAQHGWTQRFHGWHVRTQTAVFDPTTVELMSFSPSVVAGRILFFYVLPFAPDEAMVEATSLDMPGLEASKLEPELEEWLRKKTSGQAYEVLFREQGALPMVGKSRRIPTRCYRLQHRHSRRACEALERIRLSSDSTPEPLAGEGPYVRPTAAPTVRARALRAA